MPARYFNSSPFRLERLVPHFVLGDDVVARQIIPVPLCAEDLATRFKDIDFDFVVANPHLIRDGASVALQNVREDGRVAFSNRVEDV